MSLLSNKGETDGEHHGVYQRQPDYRARTDAGVNLTKDGADEREASGAREQVHANGDESANETGTAIIPPRQLAAIQVGNRVIDVFNMFIVFDGDCDLVVVNVFVIHLGCIFHAGRVKVLKSI